MSAVYSWGAIRGSRFRIWRNGRPVAVAVRQANSWRVELRNPTRAASGYSDMAAVERSLERWLGGIERRYR